MISFDLAKQILTEHKEELRNRYKVKRIGIFGSFARGEQLEGSDLDVLVEFEEPLGFDFVVLANNLEELLAKI